MGPRRCPRGLRGVRDGAPAGSESAGCGRDAGHGYGGELPRRHLERPRGGGRRVYSSRGPELHRRRREDVPR